MPYHRGRYRTHIVVKVRAVHIAVKVRAVLCLFLHYAFPPCPPNPCCSSSYSLPSHTATHTSPCAHPLFLHASAFLPAAEGQPEMAVPCTGFTTAILAQVRMESSLLRHSTSSTRAGHNHTVCSSSHSALLRLLPLPFVGLLSSVSSPLSAPDSSEMPVLDARSQHTLTRLTGSPHGRIDFMLQVGLGAGGARGSPHSRASQALLTAASIDFMLQVTCAVRHTVHAVASRAAARTSAPSHSPSPSPVAPCPAARQDPSFQHQYLQAMSCHL
ncbi:unnamed protein product [Closterium sp. Naga37s-1]|nr:unnamed protein product [Closterium sp. Naga37s-1]